MRNHLSGNLVCKISAYKYKPTTVAVIGCNEIMDFCTTYHRCCRIDLSAQRLIYLLTFTVEFVFFLQVA